MIQAQGPQESSIISISPQKRAGRKLTSKVDDKQPNHADSSPSSGLVSLKLVDVLGKNDGDDKMASTHANSANSQDRLTAESINPQDCRNGSNKHDNTNDTSGQETGSVAAEAKLSKDLRGVVQNLYSSAAWEYMVVKV